MKLPVNPPVYPMLAKRVSGLPAGEVARLLDVQQNTMSTHLAILSRAGLVGSRRQGRTVIYRAVVERVRELANFLLLDCCGGRPELCEPGPDTGKRSSL